MKTLVDEIRDIVGEARTRGLYPVLTDAASGLIGRSCWSEKDEAELFTIIADRIEREYLPRPRFEDGEPVKVGDMVVWTENKAKRVDGIYVDVYLEGACLAYDSILKRPEPEVLDADGVPIIVGDVVYFSDNGEAFDVLGIESDGDEPVHIGRKDRTSTDAWVSPGDLTHKQPDTLESIEADASMQYGLYWGCAGVLCLDCPAMVDGKKPWERYATDGSCERAQKLDLLRRQREVLERGQE